MFKIFVGLVKRIQLLLFLIINFIEIEIVFFVLKEWIDVKLRWNFDDYGGIKIIRVFLDFFWILDIVLFDK